MEVGSSTRGPFKEAMNAKKNVTWSFGAPFTDLAVVPNHQTVTEERPSTAFILGGSRGLRGGYQWRQVFWRFTARLSAQFWVTMSRWYLRICGMSTKPDRPISLSVFLALVAMILLSSTRAQAACEPGPPGSAFYTDANYSGDCRQLPVGDYATATSTGLPNDSVSSIRVGSGAQVRVCGDENFAGTCVLLTANAPYLGNLSIGNDQLTSAKVRPLGVSDMILTPGAVIGQRRENSIVRSISRS